MELENKDISVFKVNRQCVKLYICPKDSLRSIGIVYLDEVWVIEITESCCNNKSGASERQPIVCCYKALVCVFWCLFFFVQAEVFVWVCRSDSAGK